MDSRERMENVARFGKENREIRGYCIVRKCSKKNGRDENLWKVQSRPISKLSIFNPGVVDAPVSWFEDNSTWRLGRAGPVGFNG